MIFPFGIALMVSEVFDELMQVTPGAAQGFFQPFWEGALGPFALGNFRHFNRNWEIFFIHFYSIF